MNPSSTGVISSTLVTIGSDLSNRPLNTLDESLITSCTSLFALLASPFMGILADKWGRRRVILVADVLFAIGALTQAFTSQIWGMIIGRSVVGLAVGSASAVTPLYVQLRENPKEMCAYWALHSMVALIKPSRLTGTSQS